MMNTKYAVGKCRTMCPKDEMEMRQKEKLLHLFEMVPGTEKKNPLADPQRVVKMYNRSAAGKFMTNENYLRPPEVLLKTVNYLLEKVIQDERYSWLMKYDFIADRLRAIRQDMIIQNISRAYAITLLEPMVRFHAYAAYKLCEEDINRFDPHLNKKTLQECLNNLLILYDHTSEEYDEGFRKHINSSRPFFEALNIALNLGNEETLFRMICLQKKWSSPFVKIVTLMAVNYMRNNYVKVCRYILDLTPLLASVAILNLPIIRRRALQIMSVAYTSKNQTFPSKDLKELLIYESENDLQKDCKYYGLDMNEKCICFNKNSFKNSMDEIPPTKVSFLEDIFEKIDESSMLMFGEDPTVDLVKKMTKIDIY
ncbi:germinal-center associated nuclear protein [Harmonia axyridis]|uniref:germinal-center associated nuclear protein n=1 Tax=Harmonia axyridis TaxID=115357 RepID=UPI001E27589E|nr:germinal-center associated nuclear protein [Harmonia axyridis]